MAKTRIALFTALALSAGGCAQSFDATSLGVPVTMASPAGQPAEGDRFSVNSSGVYAIWGLFPMSRPSLEKALKSQLVGGKGVADLKIKVRSTWLDVLVSVVTVGLIVPRTVTFEGVITGGAPTP